MLAFESLAKEEKRWEQKDQLTSSAKGQICTQLVFSLEYHRSIISFTMESISYSQDTIWLCWFFKLVYK